MKLKRKWVTGLLAAVLTIVFSSVLMIWFEIRKGASVAQNMDHVAVYGDIPQDWAGWRNQWDGGVFFGGLKDFPGRLYVEMTNVSDVACMKIFSTTSAKKGRTSLSKEWVSLPTEFSVIAENCRNNPGGVILVVF